MLFAAVDGGWAVGGGATLLAIVGLVRLFFGDRTVDTTLKQEISGLRADLATERKDRREDIGRMNEQLAALNAEVQEQRTEKHRLNNELGQSQMLLGVIVELAEKCTCGALEVVRDLMAKAPTPFTPRQRSSD